MTNNILKFSIDNMNDDFTFQADVESSEEFLTLTFPNDEETKLESFEFTKAEALAIYGFLSVILKDSFK